MYTCHCVWGLFSRWFPGLQTSYIQNLNKGLYPFSFLFLFEKNYYTFIGIFGSNMGRSCIHLSQFFPSYIVIVQYINHDLFWGTVYFYSSVSLGRMCRFVQPQSRQKTILSPKDLPHATHLQLYLPFSSTF